MSDKLTQRELVEDLTVIEDCAFGKKTKELSPYRIRKVCNQIKEQLQQKPTVSNKKIEDMASQIACDYPCVVFPNLIPIVRNIAKEFGVEVSDE